MAPDLDVVFVPNARDTITGIGIAIMALPPGEVGTGYSAGINIEHADGRTFYSLACTADIAEDAAIATTSAGTRYRIRGRGECSSTATASPGSITISPFQFTVTAVR
jgi:hypothetical protein